VVQGERHVNKISDNPHESIYQQARKRSKQMKTTWYSKQKDFGKSQHKHIEQIRV
jgi:hypothetical protein